MKRLMENLERPTRSISVAGVVSMSVYGMLCVSVSVVAWDTTYLGLGDWVRLSDDDTEFRQELWVRARFLAVLTFWAVLVFRMTREERLNNDLEA